MRQEVMARELLAAGWTRGPSFGKPDCWFGPDGESCYDRIEEAHAVYCAANTCPRCLRRKLLRLMQSRRVLVDALGAHSADIVRVVELLEEGRKIDAGRVLEDSLNDLAGAVDAAAKLYPEEADVAA